jgi:hypothetical protein
MTNAKIINILDHEICTSREQIIHENNTSLINFRTKIMALELAVRRGRAHKGRGVTPRLND